MIVCYDLDKTISADPDYYQAEMDGHRRAGHGVHVLSGVESGHATNSDLLAKSSMLHDLGLAHSYDRLAVVDGPHEAIPRNKVAYMRQVGATHIVDNRGKTCKLARKAGFTAHHHLNPRKKG